jgi:phenylalanyl-tRNA synthetase alpha chain
MTYLTPRALAADLALRDLTDPAEGPHAVQLIVDAILTDVTARWNADLVVHRGDRIVDVADNYDRLGYTPDAATRDARYTRYVDARRLLRSQTSALVPPGLRRIAATGRTEVVLACPGVVYRRDTIDRLHTGTPHQLDVWRLTAGPAATDAATHHPSDLGVGVGTDPYGTGIKATTTPRSRGVRGLDRADLLELIEVVVGAALPGMRCRTVSAAHPYTTGGLEIQALVAGRWVEIGECGLAASHVLRGAGLRPEVSGLALGVGLDRLVMVRKGIDDIRLLRSADPRVAGQLLDLAPYRPVSAQPAARRDVSVAVPEDMSAEEIGGRIRDCLGRRAHLIEEVRVLSETPPDQLPPAARDRLAIRDGEVNVLLRVVLRDLTSTVTNELANALRDRIYAALHHMATPAASW